MDKTTVYIDKCRYEFQKQKFRNGIPVHTVPFRGLVLAEINVTSNLRRGLLLIFCFK
jgi:CYTH domain-containing protein